MIHREAVKEAVFWIGDGDNAAARVDFDNLAHFLEQGEKRTHCFQRAAGFAYNDNQRCFPIDMRGMQSQRVRIDGINNDKFGSGWCLKYFPDHFGPGPIRRYRSRQRF